MSKKYIADVLKRLRVESGMTADEVGAMVGKSGKTVNGWENARSQPDAEMLFKLCDIYNVKDVLSEFSGLKDTVKTIPLALSPHENKVITAYRQKPEMQPAVDKLLEIEEDEYVPVVIAARSADNRPVEVKYISKEKLEQLHNAESVEDEVDL